MTAQKWKIAQNGNVVLEDGTEVFDTDNINPEALQDLCDDWNSGMSNEKIKSNLEKDERLTGDEVDYIMEQIEIWEEKQIEELTVNAETVVEEPVYIAAVDPIQKTENEGTAIVTVEKKQRKPRQARTTPVTCGSKSISAEDYIAQLQEKIELVRILDTMKADIELPETMSTKGKNLLLEVEKSINSTVAAYLQQVQTM